ncbi:hypothetical protein LTR05_006972 [Lithohypha guttulata]|uniref:FAD dependent oxidoreductase domain-containing protein n=1 Tax=Lithohypha guttulata TaxID=1690604 RepID=A0AAN7SWU4_9EURO|nr:hypothetical protein LTR05_006972 [Lithohypha guttulata]
MARITIVGAGVIGLVTASALARENEIIIVARNLPGDGLSAEWASPWAGASFIAGGTSSRIEQQMQLDTYSQLSHWAENYPESSVRLITLEDFFDFDDNSQIWWRMLPEVTYA